MSGRERKEGGSGGRWKLSQQQHKISFFVDAVGTRSQGPGCREGLRKKTETLSGSVVHSHGGSSDLGQA